MAEDCIFCKIISGKAPASVVYENEKIIAFKNINPAAETHLLIVPKEHIGTFMELPSDVDITQEIIETAQALIKKNELEDGYKVLFNGGKYQGIPHIHCHLLGGKMKSSALQET